MFCLIEFGLLCVDNVENLDNFLLILKLMVVIFVLLFLYLVVMLYNVCCMNNFENVVFYMGFVVLFKLFDCLVNSVLFMLVYEYIYKMVKFGIDIIFVIYVFLFCDVIVCGI